VEDRNSIRLNIEHYRALLQRELPRSMRITMRELLAEEIAKLARAERAEEVKRDEVLAEA
jgi:hypothetical protein